MNDIDYNTALKELLFKMADDQYIYGHRTSEWIGIGPIIEEDIAFGSIAQDKVGHSLNIYQMLHQLGEADAEKLVFTRNENEYKCCHLVELPIGEYDFAIMRHFMFEHAEYIRFEMLTESSYHPLANLAKKYKGEIKYHIFHANTWLKLLAEGNEESKGRMQSALNQVYPMAMGIFEESPYEEILRSEHIFKGEAALKSVWMERTEEFLQSVGLQIPNNKDFSEAMGGRKGYHTEYFGPLLKEIKEVFVTEDPSASW